jgi:hypothetical protein
VALAADGFSAIGDRRYLMVGVAAILVWMVAVRSLFLGGH